MMDEHVIRLQCPPTAWEDGFPMGTGRIAAMIWGTEAEDRISLNHERLWTRLYEKRRNGDCVEALKEIRRLLAQQRWVEAATLVNDRMVPHGGTSGLPAHIDSYQPAGDIRCVFTMLSEGYSRQLDLRTGTVTVCSGKIVREYRPDFASDVLLARFHAPVAFDCCLSLPSSSELTWLSRRELLLTGTVAGGRCHAIRMRFDHLADLSDMDSHRLFFRGLRHLEFQVNLGVGEAPEPASEEARFPSSWAGFEERRQHDEICASLWKDTASITLSGDVCEAAQEALRYYNLACYLMMSCSVCGTLPCTLQGKWNANPTPPWRCDFHVNINFQMSYWMVNPAGMFGFNRQFFELVKRAFPAGREAARDLFGCRGIWLPMALDPSGCATPEGHGWGVWMGAAPWLARHFRDYYEYTGDVDFLRKEAYPFIRECCQFFEDFLVPDDDGSLHVTPSQSPENAFVGGGKPVSICVDSTVDLELVRELLLSAVESARDLKLDEDKITQWQDMLKHLTPLKIGSDGRLLEWNFEAEEVEPGHRHVSHLYGLYPGNLLDEHKTPELYEAARRSLEHRLKHAGGHTGWSRAWCACFYAALHDGNAAWNQLKHLIGKQSSESMLDLHPPRVFQIDGNLGGAAAMLAMLIRSEHGVIELLPALPEDWKTGAVRQLCAKGGFKLNLNWKDGTLTSADIDCDRDKTCVLKTRTMLRKLVTDKGNDVEFLKCNDGTVSFCHPGGRCTAWF